MFQASTILHDTRLDKDLTLEEVSKKTKIPQKYLTALENGDCPNYPQEPYCSLFVRDYAKFLGLNSHEVLSIFRRDYYQKQKKKNHSKIDVFGLTPQFTFVIGVAISILAFSAYLVNEYLKFNRPPQLKVNWPESSLVIGSSFRLNGTTDPESTIRVNNDLVLVDNQGNFTKAIDINQTQIEVTIESKSPAGKSTIQQKTIMAN